jgi:hypothetical protein
MPESRRSNTAKTSKRSSKHYGPGRSKRSTRLSSTPIGAGAEPKRTVRSSTVLCGTLSAASLPLWRLPDSIVLRDPYVILSVLSNNSET